MSAIKHRLIDAPAGRIHVAEQGEGPLVLLVHGFPEPLVLVAPSAGGARGGGLSARSLSTINAATGSRRSSGTSVVEFRILEARRRLRSASSAALGEEEGRDRRPRLGRAGVAWTRAAWMHPEVFRAVVGMLSVPYAPRGGPRPTEIFAHIGGPEEFYVSYFQEPGRAEAEIEPDVRGWLAGFYAALVRRGRCRRPTAAACRSSPQRRDGCATVARGHAAGLAFGPDDLDVYASEFERTGMTGALNSSGRCDRDWGERVSRDGTPHPADAAHRRGARRLHRLDGSMPWRAFPTTMPRLARVAHPRRHRPLESSRSVPTRSTSC